MQTTRHILRALAIVVYTLVLGPPCCIVACIDRSGTVPLWIARLWIRWILWSCGVTVRARGNEKLEGVGPALFMSNHASLFDTAALLVAIPGPVRFVAKRELVRIPIFGWAMARRSM